MTLARPLSIIWFERLFAAALVARSVNLWLTWDTLKDMLRYELRDVPEFIGLATPIVALLLLAWLGWMVARRGSRIAAWTVALWMTLSILLFLRSIADEWRFWDRVTLSAAAVTLFWIAALIALVLEPSRRWLAGRPASSDLERDFG